MLELEEYYLLIAFFCSLVFDVIKAKYDKIFCFSSLYFRLTASFALVGLSYNHRDMKSYVHVLFLKNIDILVLPI